MTDIECTAEYVDCTGRGGYDPVDPCNQTCVNDYYCPVGRDCSNDGGYFEGDPDPC